jgi:hypothetical protein
MATLSRLDGARYYFELVAFVSCYECFHCWDFGFFFLITAKDGGLNWFVGVETGCAGSKYSKSFSMASASTAILTSYSKVIVLCSKI